MADHLTEEEQIETLKRWWAENGRGIVTGITLALAGYFGYQWWQNSERSSAEGASNLYQSFVAAVTANEGQPDDKQMTTARSLAQQLKDEYGSRIYASQAALRVAALAAADNDLEAATEQLQWVLANTGEDTLKLLATRRLAAVVSARGQPDEALAMLGGDIPDAFAALYAETRGDILLQQGDEEAARLAYEQAIDELLPEQAASAQLLRLKADSIAAAPEDAAEESPAGNLEPAEASEEEAGQPQQESDEQ
ncbi:YfgM family protein [Microbulbifer sp. 2201CG32-9]|uniref:YfgM family protein n=1 Tax=Microbulbifer sp. 2201CG32-9 TaxID=3232309 RepID=UPI00345B6A9C